MRSLFRLTLLLIPLLTCIGCVAPSDWIRVNEPSLSPPELQREFRGLWVATVDNIDWPSKPGLTAQEQQAEALAMLDLAAELKLNTIILQVRPAADALYLSKHEPWSAFLTGQQGKSPGYDPLEFWIEEAHARGLELHAWINPFRAWHPKTPGEPDSSSVAATRPEYLVEHGEYLWLDPGDMRARDLSLKVIRDIVRRYDVDGIHVDDYFYPYPIDDAPFNDDRTYDQYTADGGELDRSDWRRWNIDRFVNQMYTETKRIKPSVLVGISPFGIWRPGFPEQVVGFDAYEQLAADARRWLREGWLDYASPQLYWKVESSGQPFEPLLEWWTDQNTASRHVWPGLYLTRIKQDSGWAPGDITKQIRITQDHEHADGFVLFSAVGLTENRQGINAELQSTLSDLAVVPDSPWLGMQANNSPMLQIKTNEQSYTVRASNPRRDIKPLGWILWTRFGSEWSSTFVPHNSPSVEFDQYREGEPLLALAVQSWHGSGRYSMPVVYHRLTPPTARHSSEIGSSDQTIAE